MSGQDWTSAPVSRETRRRLDVILSQLCKWQPHINLVANSTMKDAERRHVADSLQLLDACPTTAHRWLDLGSGGGFPGLVVASCLAERADSEVVLVESNAKKCAFLQETARVADLPVTVRRGRIEEVVPTLDVPFDVVSARALAPLVDLLAYAEPILARGAIGLFPKGEDVDGEIATAVRAWQIDHDLIQSVTERRAQIVRVRSASRRTT
jgi:16S rRNA (guanine527-N7)-methyltransferase